MLTSSHIIQERTKNTPINATLSTNMKNKIENNLDLKQNFFDPSKSSPPNDFLLKLHKRINIYTLLINNVSLDKE